METKWFYISIAIILSSIAFATALGSYFNKPKNKYEAFNATIKQCRDDYVDSGKQRMCMEIVERAYNLSDNDQKIQNDSD